MAVSRRGKFTPILTALFLCALVYGHLWLSSIESRKTLGRSANGPVTLNPVESNGPKPNHTLITSTRTQTHTTAKPPPKHGKPTTPQKAKKPEKKVKISPWVREIQNYLRGHRKRCAEFENRTALPAGKTWCPCIPEGLRTYTITQSKRAGPSLWTELRGQPISILLISIIRRPHNASILI